MQCFNLKCHLNYVWKFWLFVIDIGSFIRISSVKIWVAVLGTIFIVENCCFLRDLMWGEIIFHLVLCSIQIKTRIEFMHGNIYKSSAKCQLFPLHGLLYKPTQWRREKGDLWFLSFYPPFIYFFFLEVK